MRAADVFVSRVHPIPFDLSVRLLAETSGEPLLGRGGRRVYRQVIHSYFKKAISIFVQHIFRLTFRDLPGLEQRIPLRITKLEVVNYS